VQARVANLKVVYVGGERLADGLAEPGAAGRDDRNLPREIHS
jgi:hypothetical protein